MVNCYYNYSILFQNNKLKSNIKKKNGLGNKKD